MGVSELAGIIKDYAWECADCKRCESCKKKGRPSVCSAYRNNREWNCLTSPFRPCYFVMDVIVVRRSYQDVVVCRSNPLPQPGINIVFDLGSEKARQGNGSAPFVCHQKPSNPPRQLQILWRMTLTVRPLKPTQG